MLVCVCVTGAAYVVRVADAIVITLCVMRYMVMLVVLMMVMLLMLVLFPSMMMYVLPLYDC